MLGVTNHALRLWRDPARLPGGKASTLYLPAITDPDNPNSVAYDIDEVLDFIHRNPAHRDHFLAKFAPQDAKDAFTNPLPVPLPSRAGLFGIAVPTTNELTTETTQP